MKINRLLEIMTLLLNKGTVTARELAERFEVSTRTIYRDIDDLSAAGVPIYTNKGNGGGISLLENYAISSTLISPRESEGLLLAVKTLQATQYPELDRVLEKLGAIFKDSLQHNWVEVDFSPWGSLPDEKNKFAEIKQAMLQRQVIQFDYVNNEGSKSSRRIEPTKLIFKSNAWYLYGFCLQRQEYRTFRISRLKNLFVRQEKFEPKADLASAQAKPEVSAQKMIEVTLHFQANVANRLYDYFDDAYITKQSDGSFLLTVLLPAGEWLYSYILSFGGFAEVLEPESIRQIIGDRLKQACQLYEK